LSSWARRPGAAALISDHRAPDVINQSAFEATLRFAGRLVDRHGVECRIELAIAALCIHRCKIDLLLERKPGRLRPG
jgi:hypothetical protein